MIVIHYITTVLVFSWLSFFSEANTCGNVSTPSINSVYIRKTFNMTSFFYGNWGSTTTSEKLCAISCSQQVASPTAWFTCTGYIWLQTQNQCNIFAIAKETYIDFQPDSDIFKTLNINKNGMEIYNNYKFLGIGDFNHSFLGIYGPGSNFLPQKNFARFWDQDSSLDLLVSAVDTPMVANEGVTFNWLRRQFIFCGGQQSTLSTSMSPNCWTIKMGDPSGLWSGFTLKVGRRYPTLVSMSNKVYVLSGEISSSATDIVEVINLDANTVETLTGPDGQDLQIKEFVNARYSCGIALEDMNSFIVTGGMLNGIRYLNNVVMVKLDGNYKETLPNMTTPRWYHECSKITRYGRNYIIVIGGQGLSGNLHSIELYDLTRRPTTWEVWTGVSIPVTVGFMMGSVVMRFDDDYCNVMIISLSAKMVLQCNGNHQWSQNGISMTITKGNKKMAKIDANLFF